MIEKGLGGDWETLRHYLRSMGSLGTRHPGSRPVAKTGSMHDPTGGQGPASF